MRPIGTKFGTIYVECFNAREEKDRIKIFDSHKRYLDYFSIEYLIEHAKINNCTKLQQLNKYLEGLKQCSEVKNALHYLGVGYEKVSSNWKEIAKLLEENTGYKYKTAKELLKNEWVNKIGKYYILVCEN